VLDVTDRDVALTQPYQARRRMTLTYPVLNRARQVLWLVTGGDKVDALQRLRAGDRSIPAGRIDAERQLVIADAAATSGGPR
jgi:6-phosphogluconolactonase/glucosamine-6-phosphate isomerase/deaminase